MFDRDFFKRFEALYRQLEQEVPHTDSVDSILTARHVYGVDDEMVVQMISIASLIGSIRWRG